MRRCWGERLSATVFILLSIYFGWLAQEFPTGGGTFPLFACGGAVVLSVLMIVASFFDGSSRLQERIAFDFSYRTLKPLYVAALVVVYILAIFEIGYFTASALFLVVSCLMVGIRNYRAIVITAVFLFPAMYAFFEMFLNANLPRGILI